MSMNAKQYTIRNIPIQIDRILKKRARDSGKSFNQIVVETLAKGVGEVLKPRRDFSEVVGSLSEEEASLIEEEIVLQHTVDPKLWNR